MLFRPVARYLVLRMGVSAKGLTLGVIVAFAVGFLLLTALWWLFMTGHGEGSVVGPTNTNVPVQIGTAPAVQPGPSG